MSEKNKRPEKANDIKLDEGPKKRAVIVRWLNVDEMNVRLPITVNHIAKNGGGRKQFTPGELVYLTPAQIGILKDAKESSRVEIPGESAIYDAEDPKFAAVAAYPSFNPVVDYMTGLITMVREQPRFSVEYRG